ncbi:J domain-containing protein [Natrinema sp. 74]|uniref:J domain-containing protein n=1 Tax=Natrinema sp. 74 TaxID=3384159 RepID=UPI0038D3681E
MTEDFYDLLEIPSDASQDEIKDAYREQVRVYHPDLNDDDRAQAQFTAVKTAYDILGDPVERQAYDRLGHEEYVAKRTSGLPSPDVWKSDDDDEKQDGTELSYSESDAASATASATAGSATASSAGATAGAGGTTASRSSTTAGASGTASGTGGASTGAAGASSAAGTGTGTAGASDSTRSGSTDTRSRGTGTRSSSRSRSRTADNPLVRWWRRQNFSPPLIWLSVVVYAAGLGHFALANRGALGSLWAAVRAAGGSEVPTLLTEGRHGIETTTAFVSGVEFVTPPLEPTLWYAALAGVVALASGALLVARAVRREDTWGAVTINETIVVALALGATTTLVGGPLLAGTVLMPFLFGVIVRHTRRLPGWQPSYLYVVPVLAPAAGFGAAAAGAASLPVDIAAFVIVPLIGGLALPLRTTIRKHFGR